MKCWQYSKISNESDAEAIYCSKDERLLCETPYSCEKSILKEKYSITMHKHVELSFSQEFYSHQLSFLRILLTSESPFFWSLI